MEQFSKEMKKIIQTASNIYLAIKDKNIIMTTKEHYNNHDKKCLALFLAILKEENMARVLLEDFNINYNTVLKTLSLTIKEKTSQVLPEIENLVLLLSDSKAKYYTRETSPVFLGNKLLLSLECGSSFFDDLCMKLEYLPSDEMKMSLLFKLQLDLEDEKHFLQLNEKKKKKNAKVKPKIEKNQNSVLVPLKNHFYDIDLAYGRDKEVKKILISLLMPDKSPILIGASGVGKTAIVKGLAHRIMKGEVPEYFLNKKIVSLNVAALVSGCKYVGMFEEKLLKVLDEVLNDENIILFIDEIHAIIGAGKGANNSNDMSNILKPYLDAGQIKIIGATTTDEYDKLIKPNSALKRRFEVIKVAEPEGEILKEICLNVINKLSLEMDMFFLNNEYLKDEIISLLINLTDKKHRNYQDMVNNPDLLVSILTKSFAIAKFYGKEIVEIADLIEAVIDNERLYEFSKIRITKALEHLKCFDQENIKKTKIIKLNSKF